MSIRPLLIPPSPGDLRTTGLAGRFAGLAQQVEQPICNRQASGSNPEFGTKKKMLT